MENSISKSPIKRPVSRVQWPTRLLLSLVFTIGGAPLFVLADVMIRTGSWSILPGVLAVVPVIFLAFIGLNLPVLPEVEDKPSPQKWSWIFGAAPFIPVFVVLISAGIEGNPYWLRTGLILAAILIGLGARRGLKMTVHESEGMPIVAIVVDMVRQGILMAVITFASLVYLSAPTF